MSKRFELLAPGGDIESVKAAILAGADAVYCGLDKFNARNRAVNISLDNLSGLVRLAHQHQCKIFITLNIIILENEIAQVIRLLNKLVNIDIDGVILQDLGLFHIINQHFPTLDVHASTQLNTHNQAQIDFLAQLKASRVNLSRELNIDEIKHLAKYGRERNVLMEVFVHGSYCIGFSGLCYISSARNGNSGNRGRCSQPCRDQYQPTKVGKNFPLNMKDNSAFDNLPALAEAGVYSLKVEGRIKKSHYVYSVVSEWRQQIDSYCQSGVISHDKTALYKVFNRDFSNGYLLAKIDNSMFIDNPMSYSTTHFTKLHDCQTERQVKQIKTQLYDDNTQVIQMLDNTLPQMNSDKLAMSLSFSGQAGQKLSLKITTPQQQWQVDSDSDLMMSDKHQLDEAMIIDRFKSLIEPKYQLAGLDLSQLASNVLLPFKQLSQLKQQAYQLIYGCCQPIAAVEVNDVNQALKDMKAKQRQNEASPSPSVQKNGRLSVLISDERDIAACMNDEVECYFHLPNAMAANLNKLLGLFERHPKLLPWFPAILIGDDFTAAEQFLLQLKPRLIVTNNTGIGYVAAQHSLAWIAGPQLNLTNSHALQCLQANFKAVGAFVSNEINYKQMRNIVAPDNFHLCHSIYHPNNLLTSRQCLLQQTIGCKRNQFEARCLRSCRKQTSIINLNGASYVIDKQKGEHNSIYHPQHFLNQQVVQQLGHMFSDWFIDLRNIQTDTQIKATKEQLIDAFLALINPQSAQTPKNNTVSLRPLATPLPSISVKLAVAPKPLSVTDITDLSQLIFPTCQEQYQKGL